MVALPFTWKRVPGCCFIVAGRRFCVTCRRRCVIGRESLLRAHYLRKRRRDARVLRRQIWEDLDALDKQLRKRKGTRFLFEDRPEAAALRGAVDSKLTLPVLYRSLLWIRGLAMVVEILVGCLGMGCMLVHQAFHICVS